MSKEVLDEILEAELPEGYEREGVVIPPVFYAVTEKKVMVLGKEMIKKDIELASGLPEGFVFSEEYTPRLLIRDGKVIAIEILKKI